MGVCQILLQFAGGRKLVACTPMNKQRILLIGVILFLVIFHLVGIVGLRTELTSRLFMRLTPLNLLLSLGMLFAFHRDWTPFWRIFCVVIFVAGWGIEVLGVQTGVIFGVYEYGDTLGPALLGVPVMMGVNWLMLIYMVGNVTLLSGAGQGARSALGAALMVLMDILIEPFGIRFDMWQWAGDLIPFQNYLAWFLISWAMLRYFHAHNLSDPNPVAFPLFLIQLGFFASFML